MAALYYTPKYFRTLHFVHFTRMKLVNVQVTNGTYTQLLSEIDIIWEWSMFQISETGSHLNVIVIPIGLALICRLVWQHNRQHSYFVAASFHLPTHCTAIISAHSIRDKQSDHSSSQETLIEDWMRPLLGLLFGGSRQDNGGTDRSFGTTDWW